MAKIQTIHRNKNSEQVTERVVTVDGEDHRFELTDDGHEYQGEGRPPKAALGALSSAFGDDKDNEE